MISKCLFIAPSLLRSGSQSHVHWGLILKLNTLKENRLFHISSVLLEIKNEPKDFQNFRVLKVWKNMTLKDIAKGMKISLRDLAIAAPKLDMRPDEEITSFSTISAVVHRLGWKLQVMSQHKLVKVKKKTFEGFDVQPPSKAENLIKRPPIVTVMGHVDHGKTTLLDSLRSTFVVQQEFGGITQHIGAFSVEVKSGERITFIDTPGHAAFTAMRARGADITDLVVLVIAADDGVMDQTVESIKIANQADVPIIVAVNKIDKPTAQSIDVIKEKLLWEGVQVEDRGGDVQLVPISALKKINLDLLTEMILLQAEIMELKGDPTGLVEAVVIESKKENAGITATLIIVRGTLKKEKIIIAGKVYARVRKILDENGRDYEEALPSTPVQVLGWKDLPSAGDKVFEVDSEKKAKLIIKNKERILMGQKQESDQELIREKQLEMAEKIKEYKQTKKSFSTYKERRVYHFEAAPKLLQEFNTVADTGPHLKIIVKADVYGSLEVLLQILNSYDKNNECKLSVVSASVGQVTPKDVEVAKTVNALIYAFNVNVHESTKAMLGENEMDIRFHNVIYKVVDDLKEELSSRIPPSDAEEVIGEAEVLQGFVVTHAKKKVPVAGSKCTHGQLEKDALFRIIRDDHVIYDGQLDVMKNVKIVVKTIVKGQECGLLFESFPDKFQPGDKIICYKKIKVDKTTSWNPGF